MRRKVKTRPKREPYTLEELLPCPFCGNEAHVVKGGYEHNPVWIVYCSNTMPKAFGGICDVKPKTTPRATESAAVMVWNTRHS